MPTPMDLPLSQCYHNITDLPLSRFIEISTTGVLYPLIISGHPTNEELLLAWDNIIDQYSSAMGSAEQTLYLSLFKEINRLTSNIEEVRICVHWLKDGYNGRLVSRLNNVLNTTFVFDINNPEQYDKNLRAAISRSKAFKVNLDLKLMHFAAIKEKQEVKDSQPTKEYYQGILLTLGTTEHGYNIIEADKISVYMFCEMIKRYVKKIEQLEKARQKR